MEWYAFETGDFSVGIGDIVIRKFKSLEEMTSMIKAPYVLRYKEPFFANTYLEAVNKIKNE